MAENTSRRIEALFGDIERLAERPDAGSASIQRELDVLRARVAELEAHILKNGEQGNAAIRPAPPVVYEREQVGYAYTGTRLEALPPSVLETLGTNQNALQSSLAGRGGSIGRIIVEPPPQLEWTKEDVSLAEAVARQVSLQIQNLRLLTAAERAHAEAESASRRFIHQSWESFLDGIRNNERIGYVYDQAGVSPVTEAGAGEPDIREDIEILDEHIGSLLLQSDPARLLAGEDREMVAAVARQVAQQVENLRLLADAAHARAEAEEATMRLTREGWQEYLRAGKNARHGFVYDLDQVKALSENDAAADPPAIVSPIRVRNEVIGELKTGKPRAMSAGEAEQFMAQVSSALSSHLENLRLLEQSMDSRNKLEAALDELSANEARLSEALDIARLGNWEYDVEKDLFTFNDHFYAIFRTNVQEVGSYQISSAEYAQRFVHPDDLPVVGEEIGKALSSTERFYSRQLEHRILFPDGSTGYISVNLNVERDENGRITRYYGANQDITERKVAEEIIAERANQLETVAAVSTAASTILNPDALLQSVVDLAKERFGLYHVHIYLADESWNTLLLAAGAGEVGRAMSDSGHAIQMDAPQSLVARSHRERKAVIVNDVRSDEGFLPNPLLPDTRAEMAVPMIVGEKVIGVFDAQSDEEGFFSDEDAPIFNTLAAQVAVALQNARLYQEQAATVTQLRELDRLKSSFLANMSHELRTPLNSILGFTDVMIEGLDGELTPTMDNDLRLIQKNGQHLLHLINDVLDMAKIESGRMNLNIEACILNEVIEDVIRITSPLAKEKRVTLRIEPKSDRKVQITADRTRLRQVLINLVTNSIKFTDKGSVSIRAVHEANSVLLSIKDTGIGIPPAQLESVFQEFTQVDSTTTRKAGGTGLGLPISRRLIEMHGGRLWGESSGIDGEGATFYIFLPLEARVTEPEMTAKA